MSNNTFEIPTNKGVDNSLFDFLHICNGDDFGKEKDLENALLEYLCKTKKFLAKSQVACDGELPSNEKELKEFAQAGEKVIDIVVKTTDGYYPIELKFEENSESELKEDRRKIKFYQNHYSDINDGCVLLLTSQENCPWQQYLKKSPKNDKYSYVLMSGGEISKEENAVSFKNRWDSKK